MSLTQQSPKKIYVWQNEVQRVMLRKNGVEKQVRPEPDYYEYSYTFKWKTTGEIWNEWTTLVGWIYTNSDWLTWPDGADLRIKKDIPSLATAERIIISCTDVVNTNGTNAIGIWIGAWTWWGTSQTSFSVQWSSYNGVFVEFDNGTNYKGNIVGYATVWTHNPTFTIDLRNKLLTGTLSWFSNSTLALTDSYISTIRQMTYLYVYCSSNKAGVSDVNIKIY